MFVRSNVDFRSLRSAWKEINARATSRVRHLRAIESKYPSRSSSRMLRISSKRPEVSEKCSNVDRKLRKLNGVEKRVLSLAAKGQSSCVSTHQISRLCRCVKLASNRGGFKMAESSSTAGSDSSLLRLSALRLWLSRRKTNSRM